MYSFSKLCSSSQYVTHGYTADFVRLRLPAAWWVSSMSHILRIWIHTAAFLNTIYFFIPYTFLTPNYNVTLIYAYKQIERHPGRSLVWAYNTIKISALHQYSKNICCWQTLSERSFFTPRQAASLAILTFDHFW